VEIRRNAVESVPFSTVKSFQSTRNKTLSCIFCLVSGIQHARPSTKSSVLTAPKVGLSILKEKQSLEISSTRRSPRIRLQVPVFLRGSDASGAEFIELTKTVNISATGACIASAHILHPKQIVHLTFPAPSPASSSLVPSETPPITARVLRQDTIGDFRLFGVEFLHPLE